MEHLALLKRWYYRGSRMGEMFFADEKGTLPLRKLVRGISRVYRGEKPETADAAPIIQFVAFLLRKTCDIDSGDKSCQTLKTVLSASTFFICSTAAGPTRSLTMSLPTLPAKIAGKKACRLAALSLDAAGAHAHRAMGHS